MRLWAYYAFHSFINAIRKIFRSKFVIVVVCMTIVGATFGFLMGTIADVIDSNIETETEVATETEEIEDVILEEIDEEMDEEDFASLMKCVKAGISLAVIACLLWGMYSGSKSGSDIFKMADVNFLFTAPMKPQSVLMFRLSFQMLGVLAGSLYLLFQIPNLVINLNIGLPQVLVCMVAYLLLIILQRLMSVLSYTVAATHEQLKKYILPAVIGVLVLIAGWVITTYLGNGRDVLAAIESTFGKEWISYIPIVGWIAQMVYAVVYADYMGVAIYMVLNVVAIVAIIWLIWQIRADFYEDAVAGAQKREETLQAAQEGRTVEVKERSKRIKREANFKGEGAVLFFTKELHNRRRFARFGFLSNTMIVYTAISCSFCWYFLKVTEEPIFPAIPLVFVAIAFFRNYGNPIARETTMNWLFLVPENPYKKVFYAMMSGTYACAIDLLPGLLIAMVLLKENPLHVLVWWITLITLDFMSSSVGCMLQAFFPASAMDVVAGMIQMMIQMFVLVVVVLLYLAGWFLGGFMVGAVLNLILNLVIGGICFLAYPTLLHRGN